MKATTMEQFMATYALSAVAENLQAEGRTTGAEAARTVLAELAQRRVEASGFGSAAVQALRNIVNCEHADVMRELARAALANHPQDFDELRKLRDTIERVRAHYQAMNEREEAPTGDDYNALLDIVGIHD